jgi:hypothetical protein
MSRAATQRDAKAAWKQALALAELSQQHVTRIPGSRLFVVYAPATPRSPHQIDTEQERAADITKLLGRVLWSDPGYPLICTYIPGAWCRQLAATAAATEANEGRTAFARPSSLASA